MIMCPSNKTCKECGAEKPLAAYYKHSGMADGYLNKCKSCVKSRVSRHREENIDRIREYDRGRGNRQSLSNLQKYRKDNPNKYSAHITLNNAIRDGKVRRESNCGECNSDYSVVGHHDDYLKPLEVRWLCQACHVKWHKENGEGRNGF